MSSHREAPAISKDPVADNTDLYAFVSPDAPTKVTILANYIPLEEPAGGPNFFMFGDDVLYEIKIDNNGDGREDITYQFRFKTKVMNPNTFLYNTGPITSLDAASWNIRQTFTVTRLRRGSGPKKSVLGENLISPPVRIGPRSTPSYPALANDAIHDLGGGIKAFAGQREEAFNVDLGSIFDLGALRPFQHLHLIPLPTTAGKDDTKGYNVHTIALQVPKMELTKDGSNPTDPAAASSVVGIWATASRQKATVRNDDDDDDDDGHHEAGPWIQVSRLGNPLINEVVIPVGKKDLWNRRPPRKDSAFVQYYEHPELQVLIPYLYPPNPALAFPGFPNLAALTAAGTARADLVAILLTGIPAGVLAPLGFPAFQNFTGTTLSDMLRLNMAVPSASTPSAFGILGLDLAGFPNGRRPVDNVVAIELRAIAGVTHPLVNPPFSPDGAAGLLTDGTANDVPLASPSAIASLAEFPYLGHPHEGFEHKHD